MKLIKAILSPRVVTAVVSAVSAIICTIFAGCKMAMTDFGIASLEVSIFSESSTNGVNSVTL